MKKYLALLLAFVMMMSLAACSNQANNSQNGQTNDTSDGGNASGEKDSSTGDNEVTDGDYTFNPTDGANPDKTEYNFVYIPKLVHPYFDAIHDGMLAAIEDYAEKGVTITLDWDAPAEADALVQIQKIEAAAAKQPDAIGVAMQDPTTVNPILAEVQASGIPVVTSDEGDTTTFAERQAFVGIKDLYTHGKILGEAVAEALNYEGQVGMLIGTKDAWAHIERTRGIKDALAQYPDIEIVCEFADEDDIEKAMTLTEQMLTAYPEVDAITSSNGGAHVGAARAVESAGLTGEIVIAGYDAIEETVNFIRDGAIYCAVAQDCYSTGYWLICEMIDAADGKITEQREVYADVFVLTKDNMDELPKYGYNF